MKPGDRFPVEPLSEPTWKRIERGVFEQLSEPRERATHRTRARPSLRLALGVAAVVQVAAAFAFFSGFWREREPPALASKRLVAEQLPEATSLGDVWVRLEPHSALVVVDGEGEGSLVVLERGAAQFSVPPRARRAAFAVQADEVRVEVVGTRFRVERREGEVRVDAYAGTVRVHADGESVLLRAGARWSDRTSPALWADAAARSAAPQAARDEGASARRPTQPASSPLAADRTGLEPAAPPSPSSELARAPAAGKADRGDAAARQAGEGARAGRRAGVDPLRQRFERAARLEASEPRQALRLYANIAGERGRWGATALYAWARLELELGQRARAQRLLRRYLARYPQGENAADVRSLMARSRAGGAQVAE